MIQKMVRPTNHDIAQAEFTLCKAMVLQGFLLHLPVKCRGRAKKNFLPSEHGAPGTVPYGESGPGYCITLMKR